MLPLHLHPFFFFNDTATTEIYTLSLHDALPICHCAKLLVGRTGHACDEGEHLSVRLRQEKLNRLLRREFGSNREPKRRRVAPREERTDRFFRRVPDLEREGEGLPPGLRDLAPDDRVVDGESVPPEHSAVLVRAPQVEADDQRENLEPRQLLGDVPRDSRTRFHHELVLPDHDFSSFNRGGGSGLLELAHDRAGRRTRAIPSDPEVLRRDLAPPGWGARLRRLEFPEEPER